MSDDGFNRLLTRPPAESVRHLEDRLALMVIPQRCFAWDLHRISESGVHKLSLRSYARTRNRPEVMQDDRAAERGEDW
jgi:hypothetical protein